MERIEDEVSIVLKKFEKQRRSGYLIAFHLCRGVG